MDNIDAIESDLKRYMNQLDYNETEYAHAEPAMVEACKELVDQHIMTQSAEWLESMGPDAWSDEDLTEIQRLCYHNETAAAGEILISLSRQYLFDLEYRQIKQDWESFVE